jgi:acyl-CoA thioester hydrolase
VRLSLTPSTDPADYPFAHAIRTRFAETDAMGIVHHAAYVPYLEEARAALLRHRGHPYGEVRADGVDLAVLEVYVRYRRALRFDEVVDVHVALGHLTRTTFQVGYLLTMNGETVATAVTVHGAVDADGHGRRMPAWLAELVDTSR